MIFNLKFLSILICALAVLSPVQAATYDDRGGATLRWLDKATARTGTIELSRDESAKFGDITVRLKACRALDPLEGNDAAAFVQAWETKGKKDPTWIFSGWMYASNPGVAAIDHLVLDVWLLSCHDKPKAKAETKDDTQAVSEEPEENVSDEDISDETDGESSDTLE